MSVGRATGSIPAVHVDESTQVDTTRDSRRTGPEVTSQRSTGTTTSRPLFQTDVADVRSTPATLTTTQVRAKIAELDAKYGADPAWARVKAHVETLLSTSAPGDRHNVGEVITQLSRLAYNDPELKRNQAKAFEILQDVNNVVFNNEIHLETNFLDDTVSRRELQVAGDYQTQHPELFPYASQTFDKAAHLRTALAAGVPSGEGLTGLAAAYQTAFVAFAQREGLDLSRPDQLRQAQDKWRSGGASEEVNLNEKRQLGFVGLRKAIDDFVKKNGHEPSVQELVQFVKDNYSVGPFTLTVEGDAILAEFAKHISVETAANLLGELSAEDKVRLSLDNPWTIVAILLAILSVIAMITGAGAPLAIACGAASLGLFGFELFIDGKSGHLTDDGAAHQRMLQAPDFNGRDLYRAFDTRARSNRADAANADTSFVSRADLAPGQTVRFAETERPVLMAQLAGEPQPIPVNISTLERKADGTFEAVGYDDLGNEVRSIIRPSVVFDPNATAVDAQALIGEAVTQFGQDPAGLAAFDGRLMTVSGLRDPSTGAEMAPVAVQLGNPSADPAVPGVQLQERTVIVNGRQEKELHLVVTGRTPDGRVVTLERSGATAAELLSQQATRTAVPVSSMTQKPEEQRLIARWFGIDPTTDPATWRITAEDYANFMSRAQEGMLEVDGRMMSQAELVRVAPGAETLAALQATFKDQVVDRASALLYVGDSRWQDTSDLGMVSRKRNENSVAAEQTSTLELRPGRGTISVGLVGVDYQGSTSTAEWTTPSGAAMSLRVGIGKNKTPEPTELTVVKDGKTTVYNLAAMRPDERAQILRDNGVGFSAQMQSGGTRMTVKLDVETNGSAKVILRGGNTTSAGRTVDVDDFYATVHGSPPSNPVVPRSAARIEGEPRVEVSSTRLGREGEEITINNRRVTHWVVLGLKIALTIAAFAARPSGGGGGGGNNPETPTGGGTDLPGGGGVDLPAGGGGGGLPGGGLPGGGGVSLPGGGVS